MRKGGKEKEDAIAGTRSKNGIFQFAFLLRTQARKTSRHFIAGSTDNNLSFV
jgi:hypothetical protein